MLDGVEWGGECPLWLMQIESFDAQSLRKMEAMIW